MSKAAETIIKIPRSRLQTIAHSVTTDCSDEKKAAEIIVDKIKKEEMRQGSSQENCKSELRYERIRGRDRWVATLPAERTNYGANHDEVAVVPDMSVSDDFRSGHIGIITPNDNR